MDPDHDRIEHLTEQVGMLLRRLERIERRLGIPPERAASLAPGQLGPGAVPPGHAPAQALVWLEDEPAAPAAASAAAPAAPPAGHPAVHPPADAGVFHPAPPAAEAPPAAPPHPPGRPTRILLENIGGDEAPPAPPERASAPPGPAWGSSESLLGGRVTMYIGGALLFLAVAFLLAYTWAMMGETVRLALSLGIGLAFVGAGIWARDHGERWFSEGVMGFGIAILYLSIWAGTQRYSVLPFDLAFAMMMATTAAGVYLAVRCDAVGLSALATLGGFLTPVVLQSQGGGAGQAIYFLTYVAVLNAGILWVSLFRRWTGIVALSFCSTLLLLLGWAGQSYGGGAQWTLFAFVTLYFLLFLGASCFYSLARGEETRPADLLLLFVDATVYGIAGYAILGSALGAYPALFAVGVAVLFGMLNEAAFAVAPENAALRNSAGGIGIFFLTIAVPIQLRQGAIAEGWSVEAAVLVWLGIQQRSRLLHRAGQIVWLLSLPLLLWGAFALEPKPPVPLINERGLPLLVAVAAAAVLACYSQSRREGWPDELTAGYSLLAVVGGAWLVAMETYTRLGAPSIMSVANGADEGRFFAFQVIACEWAAIGCAVALAGHQLRHPGLRQCAFLVMGLAALLAPAAGVAFAGGGEAPFAGIRPLAILAVIAALAITARRLGADDADLEPVELDAVQFAPIAVALLAVWGISVELYGVFAQASIPTPETWRAAAIFGLSALWSAAGAAIVWAGARRDHAALRMAGFLVMLLGLVALLPNALATIETSWPPVMNFRFLAFAAAMGSAWGAVSALQRMPRSLDGTEAGLVRGIGYYLVGLFLWCVTQETYQLFFYYNRAESDWGRKAQLAISLVWIVCGAALMWAGVSRHSRKTRLAALGLLFVTVLKLFLLDLSYLEMFGRICSFGAMGLTLIGIAWVYSRYGIGKEDE